MTELTGRRPFRWIVAAASLAIAVSLIAVAYSVADRRAQAEAAARAAEQDRQVICEGTNRGNDTIIDILNLARSLNGQRPLQLEDCQPTPAGEEFYCRALERLKPIPCGT